LLRISPVITLLCFAILLGFALLLRKVFGALRPIFLDRSILYADITGRLSESLGGVRVVKSYRAEARESAVFATGVRALLTSIMRSLTATSMMSLSSTTVVGVIGALVMWMGALQILHGSLTLGSYVSYTVFLAFLIAPVFQVVSIGTQLTEAFAGFDRTLEVLSEKEEDSDPHRTIDLSPRNFSGEVCFEGVSFAYQSDKPVLREISFEAVPGSITALVGPSGSGKSTILSLICAFHNPDKGVIRVDGLDLSTARLESFRSQLGVVLQESFLFDGSIRENIRFSKPAATEEQILQAARVARVDEFALRFPDGYETVVGERGVKLSGGQRQRISIARAVLANPRILVLDEATSSLDSESEALIQQSLAQLMQGRTTFVIAHRLSTIRRADQILFIEHGRIHERGTHSELLRAKGRYYELYTRQHTLEDNLFLAPGEGGNLNEDDGEPAIAWSPPSFSQALRGLG
jgi:ABC-type multidrug transport system fused ATPase/permease subunit